MSFSLEIQVVTDDGATALNTLHEQGNAGDLQERDGYVVPIFNGTPLLDITSGKFEADPIISLVSSWMQKMPWVIAGDEECVPLRNSATCFGFEPAGNAVRIYYYEGTEGDVENLICEPVSIPLNDFCPAVIDMANEILEWADDELAEEDEGDDLCELREIMPEVRAAWSRKKHER